jgi:hypothetical protein
VAVTEETWIGPSLGWIGEWERGFAERAGRARALAERISWLSATAQNVHGEVEVTVAADSERGLAVLAGLNARLAVDEGETRS